jgi:hypothetical protein
MRKLVLLGSFIAALFAVAAASATPPLPVSGSETITGATATVVGVADGNTFVANTLAGTISGSYTGTFAAEFTTIVHRSGLTNDVHGTFTCACSFGGQLGTITFRFEGTGSAAPPFPSELHGETIGGTGGLANLHSNVAIAVVGATITYSGTAHFDP